MLVRLTGGERLKIFIRRYGIKIDQLRSIMLEPDIKNKVFSAWICGEKKPNTNQRNAMQSLSKKISMLGKYELILTNISWDIVVETECFIGEILYLYRWRNDVNVWDFAKKCKCSKVLLCEIEHGTMPSDRMKQNIYTATNKKIAVEMWKEDIDAVENEM